MEMGKQNSDPKKGNILLYLEAWKSINKQNRNDNFGLKSISNFSHKDHNR